MSFCNIQYSKEEEEEEGEREGMDGHMVCDMETGGGETGEGMAVTERSQFITAKAMDTGTAAGGAGGGSEFVTAASSQPLYPPFPHINSVGYGDKRELAL